MNEADKALEEWRYTEEAGKAAYLMERGDAMAVAFYAGYHKAYENIRKELTKRFPSTEVK